MTTKWQTTLKAKLQTRNDDLDVPTLIVVFINLFLISIVSIFILHNPTTITLAVTLPSMAVAFLIEWLLVPGSNGLVDEH